MLYTTDLKRTKHGRSTSMYPDIADVVAAFGTRRRSQLRHALKMVCKLRLKKTAI